MVLVERASAAARHSTTTPRGAPTLHAVGAEPTRGSRWLRWALIAIDLVGVVVGWSTALLVVPAPGSVTARVGLVGAATTVGITAAALQHLYLARIAGVRSIELPRVARAAAISAIGVYAAAGLTQAPMSVGRAAFGASMTFLLLASGRSFFDAWLKVARAQGRFLRPIVIVGANAEGADLDRLLRTHPELGYRVAGVVGFPARARRSGDVKPDEPTPWTDGALLGDLSSVHDILQRTGSNGVVIAASALTAEQLNRVTRELLHRHVHVQVSSGLKGISAQRVRQLPLAREPFFYLEKIALSPWQLTLKRTIDLIGATIGLAVGLPVLIVAAVAIKLQDGGPILFRQQRVGRSARPFTMLKLRTMLPDADSYLDAVADQNERADGPLFKIADDPRRTRVGRILESLSIDEFPQLWNVLRGDMSLVGPRPALSSEVQQFDDELLIRLSVAPGVTGIWQVEARDNPSFDAYRRLDLFYVENWSVALDLSIILATTRSLIVRLFGRARPVTRTASAARLSTPDPAPAPAGPVS